MAEFTAIETYENNGRTIEIGTDLIRVWFDGSHYQDIVIGSVFDIEEIREGDDCEGWEDGCGNTVCIENATEVE